MRAVSSLVTTSAGSRFLCGMRKSSWGAFMSILSSLLRNLSGVILVAGAATTAADGAPLTSHPRLWITQSDLPRISSWTATSNPMWRQGLLAAAQAGLATANAHWNWTTGVPDSGWNDKGSNSYEGMPTEAYAEMFAFMSLADPVVANRSTWASHARTLLMWAMNQAYWAVLHGDDTSDTHPFAWAGMATYNRASSWGEGWGLTVDWIYASLSAADKATIHGVFMNWGHEILNASTTGEEHPQPIGVVNDLQLVGSSPLQTAIDQQRAQMQFRYAANNYFLAHMRNLTVYSMSFDPLDDTGGGLQGLVKNALGAWLYQAYAIFGDAAEVRKALGVTTANRSLGKAAGGLPVEGSLYGESLGYLYQTLLAVNSAGYADTSAYGPQVGFISDAFWDQAISGALGEITPQPFVPAGATYLGPIYGQANYGDILRYWLYDNAMFWGPMAFWDYGHDTERYKRELWLMQNANQGGPNGSTGPVSRAANIWGNADVSESLFYFLTFDPAVQAPVDPRPSLPKPFLQSGIGRILARSDWTPLQSWFTFRCSWETINHISGDCGEFEYFRKGHWLTKEWSGYADDGKSYSPLYHNTLSIKNRTPADAGPNFLWESQVLYGGQWNNGGNAGDPSLWLSVDDNHAVATVDATNLYNLPDYWTAADAATDITKAIRSIAWVDPDAVVIYDRVATKTTGRFRYQNFALVGAPSIAGKTAISVSGNQQLTLQSLLPANAALAEQHFWKTNPSQEFDLVAQLDPATDRLLISDPAMPLATNFLTVLQGSDKGVSVTPATVVNSTSGPAFQGAVVGTTAIMFALNPGAVSAFSYLVPNAVTRHLISGLAPGKPYVVAFTEGAGGTKVTVTPGGTNDADKSGVLAIGFPASTSPIQAGYYPGTALMQPE